MSTSQKVWVINPPKPAPKRPSITAGTTSRTDSKHHAPHRSDAAGASAPWLFLAKAYLLGPVLNLLEARTRANIVWAAIGLTGLGLAITAVAARGGAFELLGRTPGGVVLWIVMATLPILLVSLSWARAIVIAGRDEPFRRVTGKHWWRRPGAVGGLGMLVPGLGLFMTGFRWRAGAAVLAPGLLLGAALVLSQWRWAWTRSQSDIAPGISGTSLEVALITAAAMACLAMVAWMIQALDGARRAVSTRPTTTSSALSVLLLVTIVFFAVTFRPVSLAGELSASAESLRRDGLRVIPVALCEAASRLDPVSAAPLAQAAAIYDELGLPGRADARRAVLESRLAEYRQALAPVSLTNADGADGSPPAIDGLYDRNAIHRVQRPGADVWSR